MEKVTNVTNSLQEHACMASIGQMLAAMMHYTNVVYQVSDECTSVVDSGAARHVHPNAIITDMDN